MNNCDYQKDEDEAPITTVAATDGKEPIIFGVGLLTTTATSTAAVIFFDLRALSVRQ